MEFPVWNEGDQFTAAAFTYLYFILDLVDPIDEEMATRERIARITSDPLANAKIFGAREFLSESTEMNYQLEDFCCP